MTDRADITPDIDLLAATAYETGIDPITYATVNVIEAHVEAHLTITAAREWNPAAYPHLLAEMTVPALSRRILGDLMNAGWTPPEVAK